MIFRKRQGARPIPRGSLVVKVLLRSDLHYLPLANIEPSEYTKRFRGKALARPTHYTIVGGNMLWIGPLPDKRYDVLVTYLTEA